MSSQSQSALPHRPRLVLRIGFAGRRDLSDSEASVLDASLDWLYRHLGNCVAQLAPKVPVTPDKDLPITAYYSDECPVLRLVTGLCEGADERAAEALGRVRIEPDRPLAPGERPQCLTTELGAVLPFSPAVYRVSRPEAFRAQYEKRLAQCAWVIALDGIYDKPAVETRQSKDRRARAHRAQSAVLLRQSDIVIAAANPDVPGAAGGTLETVREALAFDLPVIFIHTGKASAAEAIYLIEPENLAPNVLAAPAPAEEERERLLTGWVEQLTADPDVNMASETREAKRARLRGEAMLKEFFDEPESPSRANGLFVRLRKWVWECFEKFFKSGPGSKSDPPLQPYQAYRKRATDLSRHYASLYRGAFLLNYVFAIAAVLFAAVSLALLGAKSHTPLVGDAAAILEKADLVPGEHAVDPDPPGWVVPVLIVLGVGKILLLIFIALNTKRANDLYWNDRAVGTRYLAERLRGLFYLPRAASFQPPAAAPPQFASRAVRQSAMDWLFDAIVRAVSPADLDTVRTADFPSSSREGETVVISRLLSPDPVATLRQVQDGWIANQIDYHQSNMETMGSMLHRLEKLQKGLGGAVVVIVAFDLVLLGMKAFHGPEALLPFAKAATPWLIAASALLPAVVAALSGIRFQSECQALAERSSVMHSQLSGRPAGGGRKPQTETLIRSIETALASKETDLGSWSHDVLRFTEHVATDFVQEAAEWSVLYAKDVSDPG